MDAKNSLSRVCWIDSMKYWVHESGKIGETDKITTSASKGLQPMPAEPSWIAWLAYTWALGQLSQPCTWELDQLSQPCTRIWAILSVPLWAVFHGESTLTNF